MQRSTTDRLRNLTNSILETEDAEVVAGGLAKERLLVQLRQLGALERFVKVALQDCATELRRERATWAEIGEAFGSTLQSAYGRWNEGAVADAATGSTGEGAPPLIEHAVVERPPKPR